MKWRIGCSGFHYKEWKEVFYPKGLPQRRRFEYYSERFNTLELNSTFYRFPQAKTLKNWFDISPSGYKFSVKDPRLITHYKQFNDCERLLQDFYSAIIEGLQEKLGPVLYQFPPKFIYTPERISKIIATVPSDLINVVEFRHTSWWDNEVIKQLNEAGIVFCGESYPKLPDEPVINNKTVYYRFHGIEKIYFSSYKKDDLKKVVDPIKKSKLAQEAYIYFNNTATMAALENAGFVKKYLGE